MVSMPYTDSTREYLEGNPVFDRQRTASRMGIVTEVFRRRGAIRSLSPTHPVLAVGTNAVLITEEHENCRYPCGPGSPFEKLYKLDAKMLFFDLPFVGFTFIHYIEHLLRDQFAFSLYDRDALAAYYLDADGKTKSIDVYVFSAEATHRRKVEVLTGELTRRDKARWKRIGNTLLVVSGTRDAVETAVDLAKNGILPFE
jgi:aminoglycoside 3-N-acetyltransferase